MKFPFVNFLSLFSTFCSSQWLLDNLMFFVIKEFSFLGTRFLCMDKFCLLIYVSQLVTWKAVFSSSSSSSKVSNVWMIQWSDPWGYSTTLISFVQSDSFNSDVCLLDSIFIHSPPPPPLMVFFSCLSLWFSFFSRVKEVDILYFVTGWAYASRHTILLRIGTATSISCQSKYYSLFADIMSNGHNAAHNEACLYVLLV